MICNIINMNNSYAYILFQDGSTMDISIDKLPANSKVGDKIDIPIEPQNTLNSKLIDTFT